MYGNLKLQLFLQWLFKVAEIFKPLSMGADFRRQILMYVDITRQILTSKVDHRSERVKYL